MAIHVLTRRLSRRSLFAQSSLAAGAAAIATFPDWAAPGIARAVLRQNAGTITVGQVGDLQNLDPFALLSPNVPFLENVYDQLLRLDEKFNGQPALVESYTVSPDGLKFTLKIRQGVKYHSGNTMTSADVAANLERARNTDTGGNLLQNMVAVNKV